MLLKPSAKWLKQFLEHRTRITHKAFASLPCSFHLFVEILWSKTTSLNCSSDSLNGHCIFPPKQACRFWNNSALEIGQDLRCLSLKLPKAMKEKRQKKNLIFVSKGCVQNSANPKKTNAIHQERGESVEQFTFKYKKLLHLLEKFGETIAKDCPTFVISTFISKVGPNIAHQLVGHRNLTRSIRPSKRLVVLSCHFKLRPLPRMQISRWVNGK